MRPQADSSATRPALPERAFVVFDSNAIRSLGTLRDGQWRRCKRAWAARECTTGWVPHALAEVVGTNLARKGGLSRQSLREVQLAARRFDALAQRRVLPHVDEIVFQSIYDLADEPAPKSGIADDREGWRDVLKTFLGVRDPSQVSATDHGDRLVVRIHQSTTKSRGVEITQPREFVRHAVVKIAAMRARLGHKGPVTDAQMVQDVVADILPQAWAEVGSRLGIPKEVVIRAIRQDTERVLRSPFLIRMFCENVYYHFRAFPLRKGENARPSRVRANDAPDLALTTYLTPGRFLVTNDETLRRLLRSVLHVEGFLLTYEEFLRVILC